MEPIDNVVTLVQFIGLCTAGGLVVGSGIILGIMWLRR